MATISALPEEVLRRIFSYINSNVQLAHCRLVCSKWNNPANSAMFSNTIVFRTKEKAMALYARLFSDPSKGNSVRHVYVCKEFEYFWMLKAIFQIAPMPNLGSFMGDSPTEEFYTTLLDILKNSPTTFKNLKALPQYKDAVNQVYLDVLRACRSTLPKISIDNEKMHLNDVMEAFAAELDTFDNLETFFYLGRFQQVSKIELLLKGCIHLKYITLGAVMDGEAMGKHDLAAWMQAEVRPVNDLVELCIERQLRCDVVEYLVYKYPNLKEINLHSTHIAAMYADNMTKFKSNMDRIFQSIEGIPRKKMAFWLCININRNQVPYYLHIKIDGL